LLHFVYVFFLSCLDRFSFVIANGSKRGNVIGKAIALK
jgi:hypothetical protein